MKISASLYSHRELPLPELVRQLDQYPVDYFHIDCADKPEVLADVANIRSYSQTPIDFHLITEDPAPFLPKLRELKVEFLCYQYENLRSPDQVPVDFPGRQGIAITSDTPIEVFEDFQDRCSFVLFMATTPGQSGGRFQRNNFQRIRQFRERFPSVRVHVDGGVNAEISFILRNMGVSAVVSGSYLLNGTSIPAALLRLKTEEATSAYRVEDFMLDLSQTPLLLSKEANLPSALAVVENFRHGLAIVVNEKRELQGIITNADIRRGLLRHLTDFNQVGLSDLLNPTPTFAYADMSVEELLRMIRQTPFPINYLPVLNRTKQVVGLLTFNDLIKGE